MKQKLINLDDLVKAWEDSYEISESYPIKKASESTRFKKILELLNFNETQVGEETNG